MKKITAPINRVFVADAPEKFANRARPMFAKVVGIRDANLMQLAQPRNEIALILRGSRGETVGGEQVALPFATSSNNEYWLSAKLVLTPFQNKYALKSISLSIFRGEARTEKTALLRAEWDCPVSIVNTHAQPHWHAYPEMFSSQSSDNLSFEDFGMEPAVFEFPDDDENSPAPEIPVAKGFTHVHLAMAATWHLTKNAQDRIELTSEAEAFAWIENCASYLKNQLLHLC